MAYAINKCHVLPLAEESMEDVFAMMAITYLMENVFNAMMILIIPDMAAPVNLVLSKKIMENAFNLSFSNASQIKFIVKGLDVAYASMDIKESEVNVEKSLDAKQINIGMDINVAARLDT